MGTLYVVATPIGNLNDITKRAIDVLQSVDGIACEDTRRTSILLRALSNQNKPFPQLISYYEENERKRIPELLNALKNGLSIALVSDAGTPTVSDPGFRLVKAAILDGISVASIPGPSAVVAALSVSGLPTDRFLFLGFLPRRPGNRSKLLKSLKELTSSLSTTVVLFDSPHKLVKTLIELKEVFGEIDMVIVRELTKIHEEIVRKPASEIIDHFSKTSPRGEFVILFHL